MEPKGGFLILFSFLFVGAQCEVCYVPRITDSLYNCADFENSALDCTGLVLGSTKGDDGEDVAKLGGTLVTNLEITDDYDIEIDIWKILDIADEYMYNTRANFCGSLENTDAPWFPIIQTLNITSCPIPISTFEVASLEVSLDCVKDVMCHDFCGEYRIELSFMDVADKISCHTLELSIVEEEIEDE